MLSFCIALDSATSKNGGRQACNDVFGPLVLHSGNRAAAEPKTWTRSRDLSLTPFIWPKQNWSPARTGRLLAKSICSSFSPGFLHSLEL
jgi:hypothetical protein